jgi:hypothetical protein
MEQKVEPELIPRVEQIFNQRETQEKRNWYKRAFVKLLEMIGFVGTFLCTNPIGFTICVLLTAISLGLDFWLQYREWIDYQQFQKIFN